MANRPLKRPALEQVVEKVRKADFFPNTNEPHFIKSMFLAARFNPWLLTGC
jgi:hypothetical protein